MAENGRLAGIRQNGRIPANLPFFFTKKAIFLMKKGI